MRAVLFETLEGAARVGRESTRREGLEHQVYGMRIKHERFAELAFMLEIDHPIRDEPRETKLARRAYVGSFKPV